MNWFRNIKIQNKLFFAFGLIIIIVAMLAAFVVNRMDKIEKSYILLSEGPQKRLAYVSGATKELSVLRGHIMAMVHVDGDAKTKDIHYEQYQRAAELFIQFSDGYYDALLQDTFLSEPEREARKVSIIDIKDLFNNDYKPYAEDVYQASLNKDVQTVNKLIIELMYISDTISDELESLRHLIQETVNSVSNETQQLTAQSAIDTIFISAFIIMIAIIILLYMSYIIKKPITNIETAVFEISKGNLAYPIRSAYKDEIGILSNHIGDMVETISALNKTVSIVDNSDDLIFITDLDYNLVYYNRKVAETYGLKETSNHKCYKILNGTDSPCPICPLQELIRDKENFPSFDWERQIVVLGKEIWLSCKTSIIRWVDGSFVQIVTGRDETIRKEKEEQQLQYEKERALAAERENERIRFSRQNLQDVLDALPIPVRIIDLETNDIVYANDSMAEWLEYGSPDEMCGLKLKDILPETTSNGTHSSHFIYMTVNSEDLISFDVDYKTKSGRIIESRLSTRHIEYKGRNSSIGIIKDLTAEKERERILRDAADREREANQSKTLFLANMSHEIRTPMNSIIGFSELALHDNITTKTKDYLNKIKGSSESLLQIINDILDISKIEAGKVVLENIPFDISEVFRLCREIVSPKALEKGVALFCYAEPSIGKMLIGDPTKLRQALLNLLSNAVKFTNTGMIKLLSDITESTEDNVTIHFEVKDSGIGMTPEQIEKVFKPFVQADESTTREYGGTGLGLAITQDIIKLMGGELAVESVLGIGSKFSFTLTFKTIPTAEDLYNKNDMADNIEKPCFEGEVLVCEDNELNQQVICEHLSRVGLGTVIAANGKIGVDYVRERMDNNEKPFDLIFMDIHMPVMDGLEAAKNLSEIGNKTPIIALTANIMANDRETYRSLNMIDCVPKPFSTQELWACLLRCLKPVSMTAVSTAEQSVEDENRKLMMYANFVKSNQTTFKDITAAAQSGDIKLAHRLAHTLKGVAGAIGMTALQTAAQAIENSLAGGNPEFTHEQMNTLDSELRAALEKLTPLVNKRNAEMRRPEVADIEKTLSLLGHLDELLEADSFECLMLTNDLMSIPGTETLIEQIENDNFEQARETLAGIRRKLEERQ